MAYIISSNLEAAGMSGERLPLDRQPTDLSRLAARVVAAARDSGREARLVLPEAPVIGRWDTARLQRVLENLVGNALKYSPRDREVVVLLEVAVLPEREEASAEAWAVLRVSDRGLGIPEADLPHVFEPFYRGSNVRTVRGIGLSLASARETVEAHGGSIEIDSVEGQGTTVTVCLPLP